MAELFYFSIEDDFILILLAGTLSIFVFCCFSINFWSWYFFNSTLFYFIFLLKSVIVCSHEISILRVNSFSSKLLFCMNDLFYLIGMKLLNFGKFFYFYLECRSSEFLILLLLRFDESFDSLLYDGLLPCSIRGSWNN